MSELAEIAKKMGPGPATYPKGTLERKPGKQNWVDRAGGLPRYIERIAAHLHYEKGMSIGHGIATAVNAVKKMCATGDLNYRGKQNVNAGSRAAACAAVADWTRKKAQARVSKGVLGRSWTDDEFIAFLTNEHGESISKALAECHRCEKDRKKKGKKVKKVFDPNQPRNPKNGRWIPTGKDLHLRGKELTEFNTLEDEQKVQYANVKHSPEGIAAEINHEQALVSARAYDAEALARAFELIDRMKRGEKIGPGDLEEPKPKKKRKVKKRFVSVKERKSEKTPTYPGTTAFPVKNQSMFNDAWGLRGNSKIPKEKVEPWLRRLASKKGYSIPGETSKSLEISDEEFDELSKIFDGDEEDEIEFAAIGEIEKRDDEQQMVFGWCSIAKKKDGTVVVDKQGDVLEDIDQMEHVAYDFVLNSRDGGEMHVRKGVSTLVESFVSVPEKWEAMGIPDGTLPTGWWVGFKVNDKEVWKAVKAGKYKQFSVHGSGLRKALSDA